MTEDDKAALVDKATLAAKARETKIAEELRPGDALHLVKRVERVATEAAGDGYAVVVTLEDGAELRFAPDDGVPVL